MKSNLKKIGVILAACSLGLIAQAQLIDDFSSAASLANYNQTIVLAQSANPAAVFGIASSPADTFQVSQAAWTAGAQQQVFLRNDGWSLSPGQVLRVDLVMPYTNSVYSDFGLALMATATPTAAVWTSGTADVRYNLLDLYVKGQFGTIGYRASNPSNVQLYSSSGISPVGGLLAVTGLWISRPSATAFTVGYTESGVDTVLVAMTGIDSAVGNALGFYSDVRANTSYGYFDNLRLEVIPEPTSLALCGLGGILGLVGWVRRRK